MTMRHFTPVPAVAMRLDRHGQPASFHWRRRWHIMVTIEQTWQIQTAWWRGDDERIDRRSHEVTTREGLRCACLHDRAGEQWHLASIDA